MIPEIKKLLYVTDLSKNARFAFGYAASIANRFSAGITILHVIEDIPEGSRGLLKGLIGDDRWEELRDKNEAQVIDTLKTRLENFCEDVSSKMPDCPFLTDEIIVKVGYPVDEILGHADSGNFDMVVMGSHGQGMLEDTIMGSTSRRVLRRCRKPVLVIRLPEE